MSVFDLDFALPVFSGPLVPDQWPLFDEIVTCTYSPEPSPHVPAAFPSSAELAAMPIPPARGSPRNKNPSHIPRPRNAFMLFRSAFAAAQKVTSTVEHDNRHITRIIAHCWNRLSEADKQIWRDKAALEKLQHAKRYPNYRFSPVGRANRPIKRRVRRNGAEDVRRCEKLAELVMEGKFGRDLEDAIKELEDKHLAVGDMPSTGHAIQDIAPFRSPLLPPASQQGALMPQPESTSAGQHLESLFLPPCYQHAQPDIRNLPTNQFAGPMQSSYASTSDFSLFSWSHPDTFSYYN